MPENPAEESLSRRSLLAAAGCAGLSAVCGAQAAPAAPAQRPRSTVRDRLWIFTVPPGLDSDALERGDVRGGSRMTPAEGAFWLGVPNLLLIRSHDLPRLPGGQAWRARTDFEQYATAFQPLDQVVWSVVGSGGKGGMNELHPVLSLAKKYPNLSGVYLDDFIIDANRQADGSTVGRPALTPDELKRAREQMKMVLDVGLPSAEFSRQWIAKVGGQAL